MALKFLNSPFPLELIMGWVTMYCSFISMPAEMKSCLIGTPVAVPKYIFNFFLFIFITQIIDLYICFLVSDWEFIFSFLGLWPACFFIMVYLEAILLNSKCLFQDLFRNLNMHPKHVEWLIKLKRKSTINVLGKRIVNFSRVHSDFKLLK